MWTREASPAPAATLISEAKPISIAQNHWTGMRTPRTANLADLYSSCSLAPPSGLKRSGLAPRRAQHNASAIMAYRIFSFLSLFLLGHGWSSCMIYAHGMRPGRRHMCRRRGKADQFNLALSCFCIVSSCPALDSSGSACSNSRRHMPMGSPSFQHLPPTSPTNDPPRPSAGCSNYTPSSATPHQQVH